MLPPGQRLARGFPRFGTHLHRPPPAIPADSVLEVAGAGVEPFSVPLAELDSLRRRTITADFHCVAGWSATGLAWEGVPFAAFHRALVEPRLQRAATVTHVVFAGLDGYRCVVTMEDALDEDVLIAQGLDGRPLEHDRGAPARLVSPSQYGFVSVKHLSRIELHDGDPGDNFGAASRMARMLMLPPLFSRHPRSRVWREERNAVLPNRLVRPIYRVLIPPIRTLCARGASGVRRPPR